MSLNLSPDQYIRAFSRFQGDMEQKVATQVARIVREAGLGRRGVDLNLARDVVADGLAGLVNLYGPSAEAFGMYLFSEMTGAPATTAAISAPTAAEAATASTFGILAKYADPLGVLQASMSRHVMNFGRGAIHNSALTRTDLAYARVPHYVGQRKGRGPCEFCLILASRGPVYASSADAGARGTGREYHDECYCVPTLMRKGNPEQGDFGDPKDWPSGYTPDRLYSELYSPSHEHLDTIRDVTRKIREKDPSFPAGT